MIVIIRVYFYNYKDSDLGETIDIIIIMVAIILCSAFVYFGIYSMDDFDVYNKKIQNKLDENYKICLLVSNNKATIKKEDCGKESTWLIVSQQYLSKNTAIYTNTYNKNVRAIKKAEEHKTLIKQAKWLIYFGGAEEDKYAYTI